MKKTKDIINKREKITTLWIQVNINKFHYLWRYFEQTFSAMVDRCSNRDKNTKILLVILIQLLNTDTITSVVINTCFELVRTLGTKSYGPEEMARTLLTSYALVQKKYLSLLS